MYVHGNRVFQSNYMAGLRILEFDNASLAAGQLNPVAFFDVVPGDDVAEFAGTWSNYRFPSGNIVVSAIENEINGLFILRSTLPDDPAGGPDPGTDPGTKDPPKAPAANKPKKAKKCKKAKGKRGKCKKRKRKRNRR
jgi:hypothetical protein